VPDPNHTTIVAKRGEDFSAKGNTAFLSDLRTRFPNPLQLSFQHLYVECTVRFSLSSLLIKQRDQHRSDP
jgi:hypothetical protein